MGWMRQRGNPEVEVDHQVDPRTYFCNIFLHISKSGNRFLTLSLKIVLIAFKLFAIAFSTERYSKIIWKT